MKPAPHLSVFGQFLATIESEELLHSGDKVLVAISGGADSVCLLDLLLAARRRYCLTIQAIHINHRLRPAANDDERFVRSLCRRLGVSLTVKRHEVSSYARLHRLSIEEAARAVRTTELEQTARRLDCQRIAVGHNLEDNLETILLNIVRGSGLTGVCGIPVRRGRWIRPLIDISREAIRSHLTARGIGWVEDETNADPSFRRNLIRLQVLPALLAINPAAAINARRLSRLLRAEDSFLDRCAEAALRSSLDKSCPSRIDIVRFRRYDEVLQRRALRLRFPALDSTAVSRVLEIVSGRTGRRADLGNGLMVRRQKDWLVFETTEVSED